MIGYARLKPGRGFQPINALLYYAQRLVTPSRLRLPVSRGIAAAIRLCRGNDQWAAADPAATETAAALDRDGLVAAAGVAPQTVERMVTYFRSQKVIGPCGDLVVLESLPTAAAAAAYPMETVLACQDVLDIVNAPAMLRVASAYLGCTPTLSSLGVRWSFPFAGERGETQRFHRDLDDWRFLKLFIYLTDVDEDAGPHVYVLGSHKTAVPMRGGDYQTVDLERCYGRDNLKTIIGPGGTAFIAATHGIHMGAPPISKPRLILQAQYSLLPVFAFRYQPVALAVPHAIDSYVNRLLIT